MEVSEAYPKHLVNREAGVSALNGFPPGWEVTTLAEISNKITDGDHTTPLREEHGYYLLSARNIQNGWFDLSDVDYVGHSEYQRMRQRCGPEEGDILISCSGTIGRVAVVPRGLQCVLVRSAALIQLNQEKSHSLFIQYWLQGNHAQDQIAKSVNQGAQPNLFLNHIEQLTCPLPPLPEQRAIAAALSDVDALIAGLDALIAKKQALKQGTMQQLLTGKERLPGFEGEWVVRRLGEMGEVYGGLSGKTKDDFGAGNARYIPFLNIMQGPVIDTSFLEAVEVGPYEVQNRAQKGDLFFNGSSETPEEVGMCSVLREDIEDLYLNSFSFGFRLEKEAGMDPMFLSYWFRSPVGRETIFSLAQGATRYNLSKSNFLMLQIRCPSQQEQVAIAEVLGDMDAELAALEARRAKTVLLKQGMMQELLTGKTRLV